MASKPDSSMSREANVLAILARIIAQDILRKARASNACFEIATNVTDKGASENNADTNDESGRK
jgi:hypothetical protein